jgi:hypothetical protein
MQNKVFCTTLILMFLVKIGFAFQNDSNVVISSAKDNYEFVYSKKDNGVKIEQAIHTTYLCNSFRTSVPVVEFYDDKTSIDEVKIYVDGSKAKYITPKYEYYSINNIFYSDAHVCYFNLPLEKKGSASEVYFQKTITDPRYFTAIYFSDELNIVNKEIVLTIPKWMKVELKELNFAGYSITKQLQYDAKKDADIITYTLKNIAQQKRERNSPGASYTEPHILVLCKYADTEDGKLTYFNTLDNQYAWYRSLTKDLPTNTAVIKTQAETITKGATTDLDKIKKIFYWLHDNIRYIAFEDGIAGFKPDKADEVLRKKYGDCKGMANLTKELLKALGFDARLCWIGTNHIAYDYSTPSIAVDNHMICALLYQGKTYFLDATENYISFNEYAERIQGRQVLIEDGDKYIKTNVPTTTYLQNADFEKSNWVIKGNNIEGAIQRNWNGEEKVNIFSQLNSIKKENNIDAFKKYLSDNNKSYIISNFTTSSLSDYDQPITAKFDVQHNNAVSSFDNEMYLDIDFEKDLKDFTFEKNERTKDYWFSYKLNKKIEKTVDLPEGYAVTSLPANVSIKNSDYEFVATITKQPTKIEYKKSLIIKNPRLSKNKFEQWNADIEKLKKFYNEQIVLTKK